MPLSPRPEVEALVPCTHGGPDFMELRRLGVQRSRLLDFSVCSNPYGPPPGTRHAMREAKLDVYPDSDCTELCEAIGAATGVPPQSVIAGSGSMELLRWAALAFLRPGDMVLLPRPTFGEYEIAARLMGAEVLHFRLEESRGFQLDAEQFARQVRTLRPRMVFLCNPNNPTGQHLGEHEVRAILQACGDGLLVLDEAYVAFVDGGWSSEALLHRGNLLVVRSMTKDYALAGLRLGYGFAAQRTILALKKVKPPWSVSGPAQRAGIRAFSQRSYVEGCSTRIARARRRLVAQLGGLGLPPLPSPANFFLVKVGDAAGLRHKLLVKGILVRDCASFGLPEYLRIAVRRPGENRELVSALREVLEAS